jgi:hypothetical protein
MATGTKEDTAEIRQEFNAFKEVDVYSPEASKLYTQRTISPKFTWCKQV